MALYTKRTSHKIIPPKQFCSTSQWEAGAVKPHTPHPPQKKCTATGV